MKRFLAIAIAATIGLTFAGTAQAAVEGTAGVTTTGDVTQYTAGMAANGIAGSRHNLGSMGMSITATPSVGGTSTSEICVFCHTPHHTVAGISDTGTGGSIIGKVELTPNGIMTLGTGGGTSITYTVVGGVAGDVTVDSPGANLATDTDRVQTITIAAANSTNEYNPAPLWNRRSVATSFTAYGSTIGGTTASTVGGVTLACLSCHDGVTTFDNLVNAPGPGGLQDIYGDAGRPQFGDQGIANWTFMDEGGNGQGGTLGGEARLNIGNSGGDLSNDHPMSIVYNGSDSATPRASLRARYTVISGIDLAAGLFTTVQALADNLNQNRWAVKGFISTTATINDLLRNNQVECSSCHDPHFKNLSNVDLDSSKFVNGYTTGGLYSALTTQDTAKKDDAAFQQNLLSNKVKKADGLFLRRVGGNAGSGVCRTCHNK